MGDLSIIYVQLAFIFPTLVFLFISKGYSKMLEEAVTPWYLKPPVGSFVLYVLLSIGALFNRFLSNVNDSGMYALGEEKVNALTQISKVPNNGVCFIGSSTFTYWKNLESDFSDLGSDVPVFNAAFGGSRVQDLLHFTKSLCIDYSPRVIVYFCGTNNIAQGDDSEMVVDGFDAFVNEVREHLPDTPVLYLEITLTPFYKAWNINNAVDRVKQTNELMRRYCDENKDNLVTFVASSGPLQPPPSPDHPNLAASDINIINTGDFLQQSRYYLGDLHHLNDDGHFLMAIGVLLPVIRCALHQQHQSVVVGGGKIKSSKKMNRK